MLAYAENKLGSSTGKNNNKQTPQPPPQNKSGLKKQTKKPQQTNKKKQTQPKSNMGLFQLCFGTWSSDPPLLTHGNA